MSAAKGHARRGGTAGTRCWAGRTRLMWCPSDRRRAGASQCASRCAGVVGVTKGSGLVAISGRCWPRGAPLRIAVGSYRFSSDGLGEGPGGEMRGLRLENFGFETEREAGRAEEICYGSRGPREQARAGRWHHVAAPAGAALVVAACAAPLYRDPIYLALKARPPTQVPADKQADLSKGHATCDVFNEDNRASSTCCAGGRGADPGSGCDP